MTVAILLLVVAAVLVIGYLLAQKPKPEPDEPPPPVPKPVPVPAPEHPALVRMRSMVGKPVRYMLGQGGTHPDWPTPGNNCDCSGANAWAYGFNRDLTKAGKARSGFDWWETTMIYRWAMNGHEVMTIFYELVTRIVSEDLVKPGDSWVRPDGGGHQGHIAMVSRVAAGRVVDVIDCSSSNPDGYAIQERSFDRFRGTGIFIRVTI